MMLNRRDPTIPQTGGGENASIVDLLTCALLDWTAAKAVFLRTWNCTRTRERIRIANACSRM